MALKERTEEEKIALAPIQVQFGGKPYGIPVLRILAAQKWRKDFIESLAAIAGELQGNVTSVNNFVGGFAFAFIRFPEKIAELVFSYAPSLPRETIEQEATEEELAMAFSAIMQVAFPFASALTMVTQVLKAATLSPSARPTN